MVDPFNYGRIDFKLKPDATRWEGGTQNLGGIAAWGESLRLFVQAGPEHIAERVQQLTDYLCAHAGQAGLQVFSGRAGSDWSGIVSIDAPGRDPLALVKRCREAGVAVNCRGGRLRISPHAYNTEDDLDRFLAAVAD